jgi:hypothetical protein
MTSDQNILRITEAAKIKISNGLGSSAESYKNFQIADSSSLLGLLDDLGSKNKGKDFDFEGGLF